MKKKADIEDLFKESFKEFKPEPSHTLWKAIRRKLIISDFTSFHWKTLNIYYISVLILTAIPIFYYSAKPNQSSPLKLTNTEETNPEPNTIIQTLPPVQIISDTPGELSENRSEFKKSVPINAEAPILHNTSREQISKESSKTDLKGKEISSSKLSEENQKKYQPEIRAIFIPSAYSGCRPLSVKFKNLSVNGKEFLWNFGDGESDNSAQPEHVFDKGGRFLVSLTVKGENMQISRYSEIIEVYELPIVSFEPDYHSLQEDLEVYFYNYSTGADRFSWDFGDGAFSERKETLHRYESHGSYDIKLRAWSVEGCMDSLLINYPFSGEEPKMIFPTAFAPNMDGPTGGYFIPGERNNMVFHPYTLDIPVEYQLKIFNRKGNLIFESNDFQTGWDGYYMQQLQPHGVYIYKVKGKYNGGKPFAKMGDVTLIRNRRY